MRINIPHHQLNERLHRKRRIESERVETLGHSLGELVRFVPPGCLRFDEEDLVAGFFALQ